MTKTLTKVTIVSIWSKIDGLEGRLMGRDKNSVYDVEVELGASVEETLSNAYTLTNLDDRPHGRSACSTTCGDLMILDGVHYFVDGCGFKVLTEEQSAAVQALSSRDTSFGFGYLQEKGLL